MSVLQCIQSTISQKCGELPGGPNIAPEFLASFWCGNIRLELKSRKKKPRPNVACRSFDDCSRSKPAEGMSFRLGFPGLYLWASPRKSPTGSRPRRQTLREQRSATMLSAFPLFSVDSVLSLVLAQTVSDNSTYYGATDIASDPRDQPWNFDIESRCRLFSHRGQFFFDRPLPLQDPIQMKLKIACSHCPEE